MNDTLNYLFNDIYIYLILSLLTLHSKLKSQNSPAL